MKVTLQMEKEWRREGPAQKEKEAEMAKGLEKEEQTGKMSGGGRNKRGSRGE